MTEKDPKAKEPVPSAEGGFTRTDLVGSVLCVIWVVAVVAYLWMGPEDGSSLGMVLILLVVFLPLALIWAAVTTLRSVRSLRAEAARLQATVEAMRAVYANTQRQGNAPSMERKLEEIAQSAKHTETALATLPLVGMQGCLCRRRTASWR